MSDLTHLDPTGRFTGLADVYSRCRPGYPAEVLDFIVSQGRLKSGDTVADIGCGTGISSRLLAERGLRVIGIEPNDEMRAAAVAVSGNTARAPDYRRGQAEKTGLPDHSCNAVLSAQAFHWFKHDDALREFHRILLPNAWLFLLWNERDTDDEFTHAYGEIVRRWPSAHEVESKRSGEVLLRHPLFDHAEFKQFSNQQVLDADSLVGRAFSVSYAPREPAAAEELHVELLELFRRFQSNGQVVMRYRTLLYFAAPG